MYDVSAHLKKFYEDHVRLGQKRRETLAASRDACLDRLKEGLKKLADEGAVKSGVFDRPINQGSYAMHTLNQQRNDDYDIDVAVIFKKDALPESALDARKRVLEAMNKAGGNFSKPPETRTNAVTVWYADGYHVDLAVYRENSDFWNGTFLEHAGAEWTKRDPLEVNEWFKKTVAEKEPWALFGKAVEDQQFRRVVRLIKAFAKSRASWSLPGGMIITTLTAEIFKSDATRDDLALYKTLVALRDRLNGDVNVTSPISSSASLTSKPKFQAQVKRLRDRLGEFLPKLDVLHERDCTEAKALGAWNWIFRHEFWGDAREEAAEEATAKADRLEVLSIEVGVARTRNGRIDRIYTDNSPPLHKGLWLRFHVKDTAGLKRCSLRWHVRNNGDEAQEANEISHSATTEPGEPRWESTVYK